MNEDEYLKERVEDQIIWYSSAASSAKNKHLSCSVMSIVGSASIPLLSGTLPDEFIRIPIGILGAALAALSAILTLFKWQENWIQFRATSEALKHEKFLFSTRCSPYDHEDRLRILAQRIEGMISRENSNWAQYVKSNEQEKTNGD